MEFYNDDTPATRFFQDGNLVLSGDRKQDEVTREWDFTESIFYTTFNYDNKSISLSIFDDVTSEYVLRPVEVKNYLTAEKLLNEIAAEYPSKIDTANFLPLWKVYFEAMEEAVFVASPIRNVRGSCDQCGDYNRDEFIFLYVPAVPGTALDEASLGIHWEYGCFGGKKVAGVYEDVTTAVSDMLIQMKGSALDEYKGNVAEAMSALTKAGRTG